MKKWLMILMMAGLGACEKSEVVKSDELTGTWKWVRKTGGIAGVNETPKEGEVILLKLNADKTYSTMRNDSLLASGTYALSVKESILLNKETDFITLGTGEPVMYEVKNNELHLAEDVYDGFNYEYVRN
ncbi:hypothetical protein [Leadbetterella sp. DM7]|uniref:hypothetical protein n=1 Tax=Leadbetterella sp. DM7 TaxID=3235085 RepID=UPI00349E7847